ncbi:hypothetical protein FPV67DRAFT_54201 [Lyophyllum atratum]|nr:hypothetical protein FPV67DRAFT_54201 [Lyophyllum atratum]
MAVDNGSENSRPAGSGTPLNCISSNSSTIATLGGSPYVNVQKGSAYESSNGRAYRLPMADRTGHLNKIETISYQSPFGYAKSSLHRTTSLDAITLSPVHHVQSRHFQPLPPLPCTSSLQLPSFMDLLRSTTRLPLDLASHPLTPKSVTVPVQPIMQEGIVQSLPAAAADGVNILANIPRFMHPNSPYVPWTPEMRREVLRPLAESSPVSDFYACPYSHTSAEAHKPTNPNVSRPRNGLGLVRVSKSLRNLTSVVGKNIKQAANQISRLKKSRSQTNPQIPTPYHHSPMSSNSFDSSEGDTLSTWLLHCQRARMDGERDVSGGMLLDDYERMGSWTKLPGSKATPKDENQFLNTGITVHQSSPRNRHTQTRRSSSSKLFHSHSDPQLVGSLRRPRSSRENVCITGTLSKRNREMSMPGGWTFGS